VPQAADVVIASLSGDPTRHTFSALAEALVCAARVVRPEGRIALLSQSNLVLGPEADALRTADDPQELLQGLSKKHTLELVPVMRWADAACQAHIALLSRLHDEVVEEMFATPLRQAGEVQRLLDAGGSCIVLQDAHKMLAVIK
jgi:hypothetical protein